MCLWTITEMFKRPKPTICYKLLRRRVVKGKTVYDAPIMHVRFSRGRVYQSSSYPIETVRGDKTYRAGFHAYANLRDARNTNFYGCFNDYTIVRCKLWVNTKGTQGVGAETVLVGSRIKLLGTVPKRRKKS